ncbi:hypothetical protein [Micromonospora sp. NPDC049679]|uniref:hypothetical protein n=1 Tax=Micromonospora sp. NPDC049679 TaxID=3155920 RepID=UPI0033EAEE5E
MSDTVGGWILDTGALLAYCNDDTYVRAVVASCRGRGQTLLVCDTALTTALDTRPEGFARLLELRRHPATTLAELTHADAEHVGALLAYADGDIEIAHLVHEATRREWPVLSDRREQLLAVNATLLVEPV